MSLVELHWGTGEKECFHRMSSGLTINSNDQMNFVLKFFEIW